MRQKLNDGIVDGNSWLLRREVAKRGENGRKWMVSGPRPDPTLQRVA